MGERRYSRRHQDDSTRSDRLAAAAAALGIDDGRTEWNGMVEGSLEGANAVIKSAAATKMVNF